MDIRKSPVHVVPQQSHLRIAGSKSSFRCHKCHRDLPEFQFKDLGPDPRNRVIYLHPWCNGCRKLARSKWAKHPLVTIGLLRYAHRLVLSTRHGASQRGIVLAIDDGDVVGLWIKQEGKCALTGEVMSLDKSGRLTGAPHAMSIDRIDSNRSYTMDNIHLVCRMVNLMKSTLTVEDFGWWCQRVVLHALKDKPA